MVAGLALNRFCQPAVVRQLATPMVGRQVAALAELLPRANAVLFTQQSVLMVVLYTCVPAQVVGPVEAVTLSVKFCGNDDVVLQVTVVLEPDATAGAAAGRQAGNTISMCGCVLSSVHLRSRRCMQQCQ